MYLERLAAALAELAEIDLIEVHNRRRRSPAGGGMASVSNTLVDQCWTQYELPRLARSCAADLIHHPLPARAQWSLVPQVVTVHDLAFYRLPDRFALGFRRTRGWSTGRRPAARRP